MGLPGINIIFTKKAAQAINSGAEGIVALLLKDESVSSGVKYYSLKSIVDMPAELNDANQKWIKDALLGVPSEIKLVVLNNEGANYTEGLSYLETIIYNVLTIPNVISGDVSTVAAWAKSQRESGKRFLTVLPSCTADHEAVVNFTTTGIVVGENTYTATQFVARIAGLIAGLPLTVAPTYQVLSEVDDVPHLTKTVADTAVDKGEFILYHDGEKVKVARGVSSLTTLIESKPSEYQKIKLIRIYDKIATDIERTIEDNYIGKIQNSYPNKLLLISAINAYLESLEQQNILDSGKNYAEIDLVSQKTYLKSVGQDVDAMSEQELKEANTGSNVFIKINVKALDAIEDVSITIIL
ncbi:phage tail sheath subtilisin-like domain-containing protein [Fusibacter sp. 3D3]|uniref:phage tail sheath subtilisin-like domain-containing protein n=1 Tax=Fusibacter sp. 3D3 TaxID=1048380 RepID=UPI0008532C6B|nr:phage tail sheath subtilisin-like domain-containing protein [Fusibacter sp. 3D3]GAU79511.1 phage-like element PBSX [Fusibacter sp. 3D3]